MAEQGDGGSKTEKPTRRRLRDAAKKGQVFQSRELTGAVSLVVCAAVIVLMIPWCAEQVAGIWEAAERASGRADSAAALNLMRESLSLIGIASIAALGATGVAAIVTTRLQTGHVFSFESIKPQLERLNPVSGAKRIFSLRGMMILVFTVLKVFILGTGIFLVLGASLADSVRVVYGGSGAVVAVAAKTIGNFLIWGLITLFLLALLDAIYQHWQYMKDQKMTIQELRRELREDEGDPQMKANRRALGAESTPEEHMKYMHVAALVLTGQDQRTVAIYYNPQRSAWPIVIVKGAGEGGRVIVERARAYNVDIISMPLLVERLFPKAESGANAPADLAPEIIREIKYAADLKEKAKAATVAR